MAFSGTWATRMAHDCLTRFEATRIDAEQGDNLRLRSNFRSERGQAACPGLVEASPRFGLGLAAATLESDGDLSSNRPFPPSPPAGNLPPKGRCSKPPRHSASVIGKRADGHGWALSWALGASWAVFGWRAPWPRSTALRVGILAKRTVWSAPRREHSSPRCWPQECRPRAFCLPAGLPHRRIRGGF